jgi:urease accessory protein
VAGRAAGAISAVVLVALAAQPVAAHTEEVIRYGSFFGGFFHPVLGPDHLLAMLSVGIVSTQMGGRSILTVPATFVVFMTLGGIFGLTSGAIPMEFIELGIAASVVVLGGMIAAGSRIPHPLIYVAVAFFGSLHGYAHGVETPAIAEPALYAFGFVFGTATIHLFGVLIGEVAKRYARGVTVLRASGGAFALLGALFLFGVL